MFQNKHFAITKYLDFFFLFICTTHVHFLPDPNFTAFPGWNKLQMLMVEKCFTPQWIGSKKTQIFNFCNNTKQNLVGWPSVLSLPPVDIGAMHSSYCGNSPHHQLLLTSPSPMHQVAIRSNFRALNSDSDCKYSGVWNQYSILNI